MSKITLRLDTRAVETFEPAAFGNAARGTVRAHDFTEVTSFCQGCTRDPTCDAACSTDADQVCYEPYTRQPGCPE
ncbi:hypothetical protein [Longimicrobium sp.]|uniref:hypothetical protein n=1 Tax=Longimicrobium sp. TaxID=2029185 RepID=UPI002E2F258C|nr:hypothetical protein [Longimicrobium sp.]HEX6036534.1 hypothetical protein [Longimicrobium sp.]